MKEFKNAALIVAFVITSFVSANVKPVGLESNLAEEICKLLKGADFIIEEETTALVTFTFNSEQEIVVLSVDSKKTIVEEFIKSRLNYKKVATVPNPRIRLYKVPVRMVATPCW